MLAETLPPAAAARPHLDRLVCAARARGRIPVAVAYPCDVASIQAVAAAADAGLVEPLLVGPAQRIVQAARDAGIDAARWPLHDTADNPHAAAAAAVALCRDGQARALMKGSLHSDELLGAVVARETGLRTVRRLSHVFIMDIPTYHKVLIVTDAAINIAPDLEAKADICQSALDMAISLGVERPKLAILAADETDNSKMQATLEAAALCKMADRRQITGAMLEGPLALDNAISPEAAKIKKIKSAVAGRANVLVVPDLEAGNMLAKSLTFLAGADAAGIVLGARVPIILTSRADSLIARLASCAVATLVVNARRASPGKALG